MTSAELAARLETIANPEPEHHFETESRGRAIEVCYRDTGEFYALCPYTRREVELNMTDQAWIMDEIKDDQEFRRWDENR